MKFEEVIDLLIDNAENRISSEKLYKRFVGSGFTQTPYFNLSGDPRYDNGYCFTFKTSDNEKVRIEVVEKIIDFGQFKNLKSLVAQMTDETENSISSTKSLVVQSGIQIVFNYNFLRNRQLVYYNFLNRYLSDKFSVISEQSIQGSVLKEYGNGKSQCYISRTKSGSKKVLNFKVTNIDRWSSFG